MPAGMALNFFLDRGNILILLRVRGRGIPLVCKFLVRLGLRLKY